MTQYHKIHTIFKRDPETKNKNLIMGDYSLPEFEFLKDNVWTFTEKVDGTNLRVKWDGHNATFGGKTDNAQIQVSLIEKLHQKFRSPLSGKQFLEKFGEEGGVCLYGEGYGAKIQKGGGNYRKDQDFILFDVKIGDWWLQRIDVEDIAKFFGLEIVPIIGEGTIDDMISFIKNGLVSQWGDFQAEGLVARPKTELKTRSGHRIITKLKCRDFNKQEEK